MATDRSPGPAGDRADQGIPAAEQDRRRRDFFASHGLLPPRPAAVERMARLAVEPRNDCVLLGPEGSGKTALLSAFARSAMTPAGVDPQPLPLQALSELVSRAERHRAGGDGWPATTDITTYLLQLRLGPSPLLMKIQDMPGGLLLPFSAQRWEALDRDQQLAFQAPALVLCIDALEPRSEVWLESLPPILTSLLRATGSPSSRLSAPWTQRKIDFPRLLVPELGLPCERVLVALTRLDLLVESAHAAFDAARASGLHGLRRLPGRTELALHIDAARLIGDLVPGLIGLLRAAIAPTAQLAVGMTSAWGLADAPGWRPFGVRECLRFLTDGRCVPPVELVGPSVPRSEPGRWVELTAPGTSGGCTGDSR